MSAPARVAVGDSIRVTLRLQGSPGVAAYETQLLFDVDAAELSTVDNRGSSVGRLGWEVHDLGPLELGAGSVFGSYACPKAACASQGAQPGVGATGDVVLATVDLVARQAGTLNLRFAGLRLADGRGAVVDVADDDQRVQVEVSGPDAKNHPAPGLGALGPRGRNAGKASDSSGDRRLDVADVREASLAWMNTRADRGYCHGTPIHAVDTNNDQCVDIADIQTLAAAVTGGQGQLRRTQSTTAQDAASAAAANPALVVNSSGDQGDAVRETVSALRRSGPARCGRR